MIVLALIVDFAQRLWEGKSITSLMVKISLTYLCTVSIDAPLYGFLVFIMSCLQVSNLTATFHCEIYSLKQAMPQNVLSL